MLEKRIFTGGMDQDSDDRTIEMGDYRDALNFRNSQNNEQSGGAGENIRSMKLIDSQIQSDHVYFGHVQDRANAMVYFFTKKPGNEFCDIHEYDIENQTSSLVISQIANRDIVRSGFVLNGLLIWTDGKSEIRRINISRAKSGGYPSPPLEETYTHIVLQPSLPPSVEYMSDESYLSNNVRNKQFQFSIQYVDWDNATSAWGHYSKIAIPELIDVFRYQMVTPPTSLDNYISVSFDTGPSHIRKINISVRESDDGIRSIVKTIDKDEFGIPDNTTYSYSFYNDSVSIPLDDNEQTRWEDFVPRTSQEIAVLDEQRAAFFNNLEGYDNVDIDASADVVKVFREFATGSYVLGTATSNISGDPCFANADYFVSGDWVEGDLLWVRVQIRAYQDLGAGEVNVLKFLSVFVTYEVNAGDTAQDVRDGLYNAFLNSPELNNTYQTSFVGATGTFTGQVRLDTQSSSLLTTSNGFNGVVKIDSIVPSTLPDLYVKSSWKIGNFKSPQRPRFSFKTGSRYACGILYRDKYGRTGKVQEVGDVYIPFNSEDGLRSRQSIVRLTINHEPPEWAHSYSLVFSDNTLTDNFIQFTIGGVSLDIANNQTNIVLGTDPYNDIFKTSVAYDFTAGDKMRPLYDTAAGSVIYEDKPFQEFQEFEVVDFDASTNTITVQGDANFLLNNDRIEIYTPKNNLEDILYYEVGDCFLIENGLHKGSVQDQTATSPAIVDSDGGDVYLRMRHFNAASTDTSLVESFSLSDFFTSNSWSKGRAYISDKTFSERIGGSDARFSEIYLPDTSLNGLSTVFFQSRRSYADQYGDIQKVYSKSDEVIVWKDLRVGQVLINKEFFFDADNNPGGVAGKESQVLSALRYYAGEYGIGKAYRSMSYFGNRFFWTDPINGVILSLGSNGINPISRSENSLNDSYKMGRTFRDLLRGASNVDEQILGVFHADSMEYVVRIGSSVYAFHDGKNRWTTRYSWVPDGISRAGSGLVSMSGNGIYLHEEGDGYNNFYGVSYPTDLTAVFNGEDRGTIIKFYRDLKLEAFDACDVPEITNQFGQESELIAEDFEEFEGVYKAAFLRDKNTDVELPLFEGDTLRCHSLVVKLSKTGSEYWRVYAVAVEYHPSELNN